MLLKNILTNSTVRCFSILNSRCYQSPLLIKLNSSVFEVCVLDSTHPQCCLSWLFIKPFVSPTSQLWWLPYSCSCFLLEYLCIGYSYTGLHWGLSGNTWCERPPAAACGSNTTLRVMGDSWVKSLLMVIYGLKPLVLCCCKFPFESFLLMMPSLFNV